MSILGLIITRSHPCQQDIGDDEDEQSGLESSEYDWLVIDTALDVIIGLAMALGPAFGQLWKIFEKPILKLASSNEPSERSTAVGVIADCSRYMGSAVSAYTSSLLTILVHRLSDEDPETKSNAAYGIGQLITNSNDSKLYLPLYKTILAKVEPLLQIQGYGHRIFDNAAGCVCRMIMAHPDRVPIDEFLPLVVNRLPLTEDYEENTPVYACIFQLCKCHSLVTLAGRKLTVLDQQNEPTVGQLTPQLVQVFEKVMAPPEEQLDQETRVLIARAMQILHKA